MANTINVRSDLKGLQISAGDKYVTFEQGPFECRENPEDEDETQILVDGEWLDIVNIDFE